MTSDQLVIAVDGGGSKTDVALLRGNGRVLAALRGPGSSPHHLGLESALDVVGRLVAEAGAQAGLSLDDGHRASAAAVFMAGADLAEEERRLGTAVAARGWAVRSRVANDGFALLWAATGAGFGIAVTVGSGMNCVGRLADGRTAWFPALGEITGDWGGGGDLGLAALGAAVRAEDLRGPLTLLGPAVADHFGCGSALEVSIAIHQGRLASERLRELAPAVLACAKAGDAEALAIVRRQTEAVATFAGGALRQLRVGDAEVDVVLGGAILAAAAPLILEPVTAAIREIAPGARLSVCSVRPVVGAALAALDMVGADAGAAARVRAGLSEERIRALAERGLTGRAG